MNKHILTGIAAATLIVLGAGCAKSAPPAEPQSESQQPAASAPTSTTSPATTPGEVRIDLRKDETSARPKVSAGAEAKPAQPQPSQPAPSSPSPSPSPTTDVAPPAPQPVVREFSVTAKQWSFTPSSITVKQGERVRLKVTSIDVAHGLLISDYDINKVLNPGETVTVEFTADKKGTFPIICSVQCGAGHPNMRGQLIVE